MKKILLIISLIGLAFSQEIFACQCAVNPPFLTVAKSERTKTIALVKVRRYLTYFDHPHGDTFVISMEVEIEELYKGEEKQKKITIHGTNGANCLEYLSNFEINKHYVVALLERGNSEFNLSNCGEYWLSVDLGKKLASGNVAEGKQSISLEVLKSEIQKNQSSNSVLSFDFTKDFLLSFQL